MIRELIDSYSDAVMRRDPEAWGATWAEDGVWRFGGREIAGRETIVSAWHGAMAAYKELVFHAFPGAIAVEGDRAKVRTHTFEHLIPADGAPRVQRGVYEDELVRRDDRWMFRARSFTSMEIKA